jgi:protein-disulfide isomerase
MLKKQHRSMHKILGFSSAIILTILIVISASFIAANTQAPKGQPANCVGGSLDAPIKLEVFSDFQCSWCKMFYMETITQVLKNYSPEDKICVIYYEFPLQMHAFGHKAARYSIAAQRVGRKQWLAVIDALYTKQDQWALNGNIDTVVKSVVSAEDFEQIKKKLLDPSIDEAISRDIALGQKRGVEGTPSIFLTAMNKEHPKYPYAPYAVWKGYFDRIVK